VIYVPELLRRLNSVKSSQAVSRVRYQMSHHIPDDDDDDDDDDDPDGSRNVGSVQTHDAADSSRRLHKIVTVLYNVV
jgi:hypothetical protein